MAKVGDITVKIDTSELSSISKEFRDSVNRFLLNKPVPLYMDTDCIVMDGGVRTSEEAIEYAKRFMAKYNHFTDGGTPKKQVQEAVKIPDGDKFWTFTSGLVASAKKHSGIKKEFCYRWESPSEETMECFIKYDGKTYIGIAKKHPEDVENEYIGKSLSFNRAFDKLERTVNGESEPVVIINGNGNGSASSRNIKNGTIVYGHVFLDGELKWMYTPKTNTKSECTDKESDDITITMSRKEAEYAADAIAGGFNVSDVHKQLLDAIRR